MVIFFFHKLIGYLRNDKQVLFTSKQKNMEVSTESFISEYFVVC